MRTTLTIDDDIAARLERIRRDRRVSLKQLINEALRQGLNDLAKQRKARARVRTRSVALGNLRVGGIDDVGETLAIAEGESFK